MKMNVKTLKTLKIGIGTPNGYSVMINPVIQLIILIESIAFPVLYVFNYILLSWIYFCDIVK